MSDKRPILTYEAQINRVLPGLIPEIREQVLADAKARIEGERIESDGMDSWENGYHTGIDAALAALTQPQAERCPEDCDGFGQLIGDSDGPCPACSGLESDGGGAATAAGVADADLVRVGDFFGLPAFTHPDVKPGIVGIVSLAEWERRTGTAPQRPKADPKEVHSCHADCPCQSGGEPLRDFVAPVPHTEGEKACPDCGGPLLVGKIESAELVCPFCSGTGKEKA